MTRTFKVDSQAVRQLADILVETHLSEIEYEDEGRRIRVARKVSETITVASPTLAPSMVAAPEASKSNVSAKVDHSTHPGLVKSPLVGTVYVAADPDSPPFISVGDTVTIGQTLLIVEAMKVMNPIKATKAGRVTQIFVQNSMPVEFSEPLMIIE